MKKAIYKYTNKVNHKIYIGQTNNPERRYNEHLCGHKDKTSLIDKAIEKYGISNFNFEIIEWTDYPNERESYWIDYYNSYKPYGYNICKGGGHLPDQRGEKHSQASISEETARAIQADLMNWKIPQRQIIKKYHTTSKTVESIKIGHTWDYYNLTYPLRPPEQELNNIKAEEVIKLLQDSKLSMREIARQVGWGDSQISMINHGNNYHKEYVSYPIRPDPQNHIDKVEECIKLLKEGKTNVQIGQMLHTSASWVSRVNNGRTHYNPEITYPIRK